MCMVSLIFLSFSFWATFSSVYKGAKLSAAGGRESEAQHGQTNEKASCSAAFDYGLPMVRKSRKEKTILS